MTDVNFDELVIGGEVADCFIVSDHHIAHARIAEYAGRPADHEQLMKDRWLASIAPEDLVLHLGDIAMGPRAKLEEAARWFTGRILMIQGNHDRRGKAFYAGIGLNIIKPFTATYRGIPVRFTHEPAGEWLQAQPWRALNVHGHIHEKTMDDRRCVNVCVEQTDYAPVRLHALLDARLAELGWTTR